MNEQTLKLMQNLLPHELLNLYLQATTDIEDPLNYLPSDMVQELETSITQAMDSINYVKFKNGGTLRGSLLN